MCWGKRMEKEGLNVLRGRRGEEVITGKYPPNTQEN